MTSPSRRKRPTTVPAATTPARTLASFAILLGLAVAAPAQTTGPAQTAGPPRLVANTPAAPQSNAVVPVAFQRPVAPVPGPAAGDEARVEYQIQLEPPGLERISRLDSDKKLQDRIAQETAEREFNEKVIFPEEPILSRDVYYGRGGIWPRRTMLVEPNYVCYGRLYFQDLNAERYGWDLGVVHPVLATAKFWYDLALLPLHIVNDPCGHDCSTGYCLPGDPVPFMLYPPEITVKGSIAEIATILALVAIFP